MIKKLKDFILEGDFELGRTLCNNSNYQELEKDMLSIAYDTENIATYFFVLDMIFHREEAELHYIACTLLINPFVYYSGAYYIAFDHILKAIELDPDNLKYKENLLLFYHIPDKILGLKKAIEIANQILEYYPDNGAANAIINEVNK